MICPSCATIIWEFREVRFECGAHEDNDSTEYCRQRFTCLVFAVKSILGVKALHTSNLPLWNFPENDQRKKTARH